MYKEENRDNLKEYIGQKLRCTGKFCEVDFRFDKKPQEIYILLRAVRYNNTKIANHVWVKYTKEGFNNVKFGYKDIIEFDCEVEEYNKDTNVKYGLCNISNIENITNKNEKIGDVHISLEEIEFLNKPHNKEAILELWEDFEIEKKEKYILKMRDKQGRKQRLKLFKDGEQIERLAILFNPYHSDSHININFKYFCNLDKKSKKEICINYFLCFYIDL